MKKNNFCKKAKTIVPFLLLLITSIVGNAQTFQLSGKVIDGRNDNKILTKTQAIKNPNKHEFVGVLYFINSFRIVGYFSVD